jgi:signal transduction histidine kinase
LAVRDTGCGIENGSDDAVFEPFVRLEQSKIQASGLGLGLSICQDMAKLLGGSIGYVSEPGASTTFWIEIPVSPPVRDSSKK